MVDKTCALCKVQVADKPNSHIIPKFMGKHLFELTQPRHALKIDRSGNSVKVQDTPKENNLICSTCEKRLEIIETDFAPKLKRIKDYKLFASEFKHQILNYQEFIECIKITPILYKLFIYSLVWRASVSTLEEFKNFKISPTEEEKIRHFLDTNLPLEKKSLSQVTSIADVPLYHNCLITPKVNTTDIKGVFACYSMSQHSHILLLTDYILLFYTDEHSIGQTLYNFSNKQNTNVIVCLGNGHSWDNLHKIVISKLLGQK